MAMTIVLMVMLFEGRYYGMSERSERGTSYRPSSNMTIKTIVMVIKLKCLCNEISPNVFLIALQR